MKSNRQRSKPHTERRILDTTMRKAKAELAPLVRDSSRRITTMMAGSKTRSTNISVINRRYSCFDRCSFGFIEMPKAKVMPRPASGTSGFVAGAPRRRHLWGCHFSPLRLRSPAYEGDKSMR